MLSGIALLKLRLPKKIPLFAFLLCGNMIASGGEYYVSPNGNATWEESVNITNPTSAVTAMSKAQAGDIVYFRGGLYDVAALKGTNCSYEFESMRLMPANTGTENNPIIFRAYPNETPVLNDTMESGQDRCIIMGAYRKDYIIIDGLTFQTNNGLYHAGVAFYGASSDDRDTGNVVKNCTINGGSTVHSGGTQWDGLRIEDQSDFLAQGNRIFNIQGDDANTAAIKIYHINNSVLENNEVYNSYVGIFAKSDFDNCIFRNNFLYDNSQSWRLSQSTYLCENNSFYNNVTINSSGKDIYIEDNTASFTNTKIYNNTFYSTTDDSSLNINDGNFDIYNNIIAGRVGSIEVVRTYRDNSNLDSFDHNQIGDEHFRILAHYLSSNIYYDTLSAWESSRELSDGGNPSQNIVTDCLFVNTSGSMSELEDFKLNDISPCKRAGRDGVDMGANIDLVGPTSLSPISLPLSTSTADPSPPNELTTN